MAFDVHLDKKIQHDINCHEVHETTGHKTKINIVDR